MPNSLFIRQQLEHVQEIVEKEDFPERLIVGGRIVPLSAELPAGAETYSYKIMTAMGTAKILADGADDIPEVNVFCEKRIGYIRTLANQFTYSWDDLRHAEYANTNLDAQLGINAREIMEAEADFIGYNGDSNHNLLGLLNYPNVSNFTILNDGNSNGGTNSTEWRHKTAAQIYRDLRSFAAYMRSVSKRVYFPQVIGLPSDQYDLIAETSYPDGTNTTILSFFLTNQKQTPDGVQEIIPVPYLEGKGTAGVDLMFGIMRRHLKYHIPEDFMMHPVEMGSLKYKTVCTMRIGGMQNAKPLAMLYGHGI